MNAKMSRSGLKKKERTALITKGGHSIIGCGNSVITVAKFGYRDRITETDSSRFLPNYRDRDRSFEITKTDYRAHMLATVPTFVQ